jgi:hypothetical protein
LLPKDDGSYELLFKIELLPFEIQNITISEKEKVVADNNN